MAGRQAGKQEAYRHARQPAAVVQMLDRQPTAAHSRRSGRSRPTPAESDRLLGEPANEVNGRQQLRPRVPARH